MIRLAVLGNPVAHSRSPEIHRAFARQASIEISYEKILAPLDGFNETARRFVESGGRGFNVTVPFKQEAFALVDDTGRQARLSGTVNTVTVEASGGLVGDNTDGGGIVTDLVQNLGWPLAGLSILVLGAGGAVRGVLPDILDANPATVGILNRTHEKAVELEKAFATCGPVRAVTEAMIQSPYDLVISGSSAGLAADEVTVPGIAIGSGTRCYDMIYSAGTTPFNQAAIRAGCRATRDGLGMLVEQAALAFEKWCEFKPETKVVIDELRHTLE